MRSVLLLSLLVLAHADAAGSPRGHAKPPGKPALTKHVRNNADGSKVTKWTRTYQGGTVHKDNYYQRSPSMKVIKLGTENTRQLKNGNTQTVSRVSTGDVSLRRTTMPSGTTISTLGQSGKTDVTLAAATVHTDLRRVFATRRNISTFHVITELESVVGVRNISVPIAAKPGDSDATIDRKIAVATIASMFSTHPFTGKFNARVLGSAVRSYFASFVSAR